MRAFDCIECGQQVEVHGGGLLPARCPPCRAVYTLVTNRARNKEFRRQLRLQKVPRFVACVDCGTDLGTFTGRGRPRERCEPCRKAQIRVQYRKDYERHGDKRRALNLAGHYRRKYGISAEDRDRMFDLQGGKCAICGGGPNGRNGRLHVDHCHESNRIRGLLCYKCNSMIGLADDNAERLLAAAEYLRKT